jgi:hypothetical protein
MDAHVELLRIPLIVFAHRVSSRDGAWWTSV